MCWWAKCERGGTWTMKKVEKCPQTLMSSPVKDWSDRDANKGLLSIWGRPFVTWEQRTFSFLCRKSKIYNWLESVHSLCDYAVSREESHEKNLKSQEKHLMTCCVTVRWILGCTVIFAKNNTTSCISSSGGDKNNNNNNNSICVPHWYFEKPATCAVSVYVNIRTSAISYGSSGKRSLRVGIVQDPSRSCPGEKNHTLVK